MKVLVVGAFGTIGRKLVPELIDAGHQVSVSSRDPNKPLPWPELPCRRFTINLLEPQSIAGALADIELIYYLMHGMSDGEHHSEREVAAAQNLINAAQQAEVQRIIYMGSLVSSQPSSEHMQARVATGQVLASASVPITEVRAGIVIAPGSAAFEVMRDMVGHLPLVLTPPSIATQVPPIAIQDLIVYLTKLAELPESAGKCYDAAGPEWFSYSEMMQRVARCLGRRCKVIAIPGLPIWMAASVLGIVTSVPKSLARALIAGLGEKLEANPASLRALIPQQLTPLEEAVAQVLKDEQVAHYPDQWQNGVPTFRNFSPLHGFYAKNANHSIEIDASPESVWQVINLLGGKHRYFYFDMLWAIREWMDWALGGPGRNHGRTDASKLTVGERVDSWRILSVQENRRLVMKFGMKAPGGGGMQLSITPLANGRSRLTIELLWHPAGFWGLAYWYFYAPWHQLLLNGMTRRMAQLALRVEAGESAELLD
ncbi:DUF2867 domain-containing protein [Neiella sp. HB171785]|uniref:DUF2867 domain-containing protein n=1 Tax=Neiella litorisoli TaxID=2771431 RepID=A0A8J6QVJ6_9GAMM|nr:DUF2867 domain-containing protein [Neiella litorisoli]MBD1391279.1 DUF2867 domain-containing protein [Neiella litorisoli]